MAVASGEINLQSKLDLIYHVPKVKATTSTHSIAEVRPFFSVSNILFESNASIRRKETIVYIK